MSELTLQWSDVGQFHQQTISENQPSKVPGVVRLGRDPARCDILFQDRSVSALHVEIFFRPGQVWVRNLRVTNPPVVNGLQLKQGEAPLHPGSHIHLGRVEVRVLQVDLRAKNPPTATRPGPSGYGLKCPNPKCGKVSTYSDKLLQQGCPWCGFSLAAADSVVMFPQERP
ncbi:FHA domain-containing protein [Lyngbya confervoides]|uniref:FHA domain-containing protein n=1 Tax=Lyngbya confervoides BDU141951 TaxID=1574623 RepID=A0ABD4T749_9CYAN|nr:FHA domain-containing protein [Lyngbya confervoides]MCM1984591.1 FHA domain-containing protein [Lyngbya confervoides BDU141951]